MISNFSMPMDWQAPPIPAAPGEGENRKISTVRPSEIGTGMPVSIRMVSRQENDQRSFWFSSVASPNARSTMGCWSHRGWQLVIHGVRVCSSFRLYSIFDRQRMPSIPTWP